MLIKCFRLLLVIIWISLLFFVSNKCLNVLFILFQFYFISYIRSLICLPFACILLILMFNDTVFLFHNVVSITKRICFLKIHKKKQNVMFIEEKMSKIFAFHNFLMIFIGNHYLFQKNHFLILLQNLLMKCIFNYLIFLLIFINEMSCIRLHFLSYSKIFLVYCVKLSKRNYNFKTQVHKNIKII